MRTWQLASAAVDTPGTITEGRGRHGPSCGRPASRKVGAGCDGSKRAAGWWWVDGEGGFSGCAASPLFPADARRLERETGFEPATPTLARSCSTPELFPLDAEEFNRP